MLISVINDDMDIMRSLIKPTSVETTESDTDFPDRNAQISNILGLIGSYYKISGSSDKFRATAFINAANKIADNPTIILSGQQAQAEIEGIGSSIAEVIDDFISTGKSTRLLDLEKRFSDEKSTINLFMTVHGIGPVTAFKFYNKGYRTIEDLISLAPLNDTQKIGIKWRTDVIQKIPRYEIDLIDKEVSEKLQSYRIEHVITGSYRRGDKSSNDIDVLIEFNDKLTMKKLLQILSPLIVDTLSIGDTKFMGILQSKFSTVGHRIDIRIVPPVSWPFALMYFTGSQRFNILMRQRAIDIGLRMNEYGIYDKYGQPMKARDEEDIFNILKVSYIPPEKRIKTINSLKYL
jgi:DNA polymerase/3'-5' exonuclease PolX